MVVFGVSLAFLVVLFALKAIEARREVRFAEPLRESADRGALRIKSALEKAAWYVEQTPWFAGALGRWSVHVGALGFARFARSSAEYAHNLADLVSYKRTFEKRDTRSEYLKQVSEAPRAQTVPRNSGYERDDDIALSQPVYEPPRQEFSYEPPVTEATTYEPAPPAWAPVADPAPTFSSAPYAVEEQQTTPRPRRVVRHVSRNKKAAAVSSKQKPRASMTVRKKKRVKTDSHDVLYPL